MNARLARALVAGLLCLVPLASNAEFTKADLEKMVAELDRYLPHNPGFEYPILCIIEENPEENAGATGTYSDDNDRIPQATMIVNTGFIKWVKEDKNLIRAVVAHELAHLSKGHPIGTRFKPGDLSNLHTRQKEHEADVVGASALVAAGYDKRDMLKMLLKLDDLSEGAPLMAVLGSDHPSGALRAAEVADDPTVYRALAEFQIGLAFAENRKYGPAMAAFDRAIEKEPKFLEAYANAAHAALVRYYENLPTNLRALWFRPDFGPLLAPPLIGRASPVVTDLDRQMYQAAMARVAKAIEVDPTSSKAKELQGLGLVLDPDAKPESLKAGLDILTKLNAGSANPEDKLRVANNLALGQQRSGDLTRALATLMAAQKTTTMFNQTLGENLGSMATPTVAPADAPLAAGVLQTWLENVPSANPNYDKVKRAYTELCNKHSLVVKNVSSFPIYLCRVTGISVRNQEINIFEKVTDAVAKFGKADKAWKFSDDYPDMLEYRWDNMQINVLGDDDGMIRVTSYDPGSFLEIKPMDESLQYSYKVSVGMSKADLDKVINVANGITRPFVRCGTLEDWTYFPGLMMGVCLKDDKVIGITVTPYDAKKLKS